MNYVVIIFVIAVIAFVAYRVQHSHFICPKCGATFKIGILEYIFSPHLMTNRMVTCPKCRSTEFMTPYWDEKGPFNK